MRNRVFFVKLKLITTKQKYINFYKLFAYSTLNINGQFYSFKQISMKIIILRSEFMCKKKYTF